MTETEFRNARIHFKNEGALSEAQPKKYGYREKFDRLAADHFLDYVNQNFLQDVAYGEKTIKLSNGASMTIPTIVQLAQVKNRT